MSSRRPRMRASASMMPAVRLRWLTSSRSAAHRARSFSTIASPLSAGCGSAAGADSLAGSGAGAGAGAGVGVGCCGAGCGSGRGRSGRLGGSFGSGRFGAACFGVSAGCSRRRALTAAVAAAAAASRLLGATGVGVGAASASKWAQRISSSRRGEVAPRRSAMRSLTSPARRASSAVVKRSACPVSTPARSVGASTSPRSKALGTDCRIIRSRRRSSRSRAKRRGSWPASMTRSTVVNSAAASLSARALIASSISVRSVTPSSGSAFS